MASADKKPWCPICRKVLKKPFLKCASGHKVCQSCVTSTSTLCPSCGAWITKNPNSPFQKVATSLSNNSKIKCKYSIRGCKYLLEQEDAEPHHLECRFRDFSCEGSKFECWSCPWTGRYDQIQDHFEEDHEDSTLMLFKTEAMLHLDLREDYRNISLIDYREGQNFFWYKCKVDQERGKFFSAVQLIGTKQLAEKYCYEFEIFKGPVRKIKVTEICESDATDVESIFENENCVAISFETLKNYLDNDGMMHFRFRIMSIKKNTGDSYFRCIRVSRKAPKMYVSMNWECCSCDNMFVTKNFDFCTKRHIFCEDCFTTVYPTHGCPECNKEIPEPLPDEPQIPHDPSMLPSECDYKIDGCRYVPTDPMKTFKHIQGCKLRLHSCEGSQFSLWKCGWSGKYIQIERHFQQEHKDHFNLLRSSAEVVVNLNLWREQRTVQVIKHKGELFYYKHRLDPVQRKFFVIVQMVGPEESAQKFLYQYKLKNSQRVFSVQEICPSDATPINYYFKSEKCVVVPLNMLKSYMVNGKLKFEIRILKGEEATS